MHTVKKLHYAYNKKYISIKQKNIYIFINRKAKHIKHELKNYKYKIQTEKLYISSTN